MAYVYIVEAVGLLSFKIGISLNPSERLRGIQTSCPLKVRIIYAAQVRNPIKTEKALHEIFRKKRSIGEWFKLSSTDIVEAINLIKLQYIDFLLSEHDILDETVDRLEQLLDTDSPVF